MVGRVHAAIPFTYDLLFIFSHCVSLSLLLDHIWVGCWTVMSLNISVKPKQIVKGKGLPEKICQLSHYLSLSRGPTVYLIIYLSLDWKP